MPQPDTRFAAFDSLTELFPFIRCPECKDRTKLAITFRMTGSVVVQPDNPTKILRFNPEDVDLDEWYDVQVRCDSCGADSPVPEGWSWRVTT